MIYLLLAILGSAMIPIVMRASSERITANLSMIAVNYLVCSVLGAVFGGFALVTPEIPGFTVSVGLGIFNGVLYLAGLVLIQTNTRKNGVVLTSVFTKLGLLVPIVVSVLFFHEIPTWTQFAGFCMAVFAILLVNLKKNQEGGSGFGMGLILLLLLGGGADAMSKVYEVLGPAELSDQFLFYTFTTALVLCVGLVICKKERPGLQELLFGTLIGAPNFFSSKFLIAALGRLPAVVVYPSFSVATMLIVTLTGVVVFRERLSKVQWAALAVIITALILLNV